MKLEMEQHVDASSIELDGPWDLAFVGDALDERGAIAIAYSKESARETRQLGFHVESQSLVLDGSPCTLGDIEAVVSSKSVLLESTTLGFVELFLALRTLQTSARPVADIIYLEPREYGKSRQSSQSEHLRAREFSLTDRTGNYTAVPTAGLLLSEDEPVRVACLLGFEGSRLARIFEEVQVRAEHCALVFGVPAFRPGWEMNSFANNIEVTFENRVDRIAFAGAQNPQATIDVLAEIHRGAPDGRLLIAPIGTKPHGIAAALYACSNEGVGLIYDHPVKSAGRSGSHATWHRFSVSFA